MNTVFETVNRVAQGLLETTAAESWFAQLAAHEKEGVLLAAVNVIEQAHPRARDAETAVTASGLTPTYTPCVLLRSHPIPEALARTRTLPAAEHAKSFRLLLALFTIADERRRREKCRGKCTHEWHKLK